MKLVKESLLDNKEAIEELANVEHASWSRWMKYLFSVSKENEDGSVTIPKDKVDRWKRQLKTDYENLSNKEKESDKKEVKKFIEVLKDKEGNKVKGGKGDKLSPKDVCPKQLKIGIAVEREHTDSNEIATDIALDHLAENPKYYTDLVEKGIADEKEAINIYKKYFGDKKITFK